MHIEPDDIESIKTIPQLAEFILRLRSELLETGDWENPTLERYLESMSACLKDIEGTHFDTMDGEAKVQALQFFANILMAASMYE